jgi:uncharacterized protein YjbI with pentapeptide repeats
MKVNGHDIVSGANLRLADLCGADLRLADLSGADLCGADLRLADLSGADLCGATLSGADLSEADLSGAKLSGANLQGTNLRLADLSGAKLSGAALSDATLSRADLSGTVGVKSQSEWIAENFEATGDGYVVYKAFGATDYSPPTHWEIAPGMSLAEVCNPDRATACGSGVNFATLEWCVAKYPHAAIWRCLINWRDLPGVVVPFDADGKARCERLTLLEPVPSPVARKENRDEHSH